MHWIQVVLAWLDDPIVKGGALLVVTTLIRRNPAFVNEAAAGLTGIISILTWVLHVVTGGLAPTALGHSTGLVMMVGASAVASIPWWQSLLFNGVLPWLVGYGGQRTLATTGAWVSGQPQHAPPAGQPALTHPLQIKAA